MRLFPRFSSESHLFGRLFSFVVLVTLPCSLFAADSSAPLNADTVIYPKGGAQGAASTGSFSGAPLLVLALLLAAAGVWIMIKRRQGDLRFGAKAESKKLAIEETKSLGNRQYLVVASYSGRKFLLGVTTDRIELLTHLTDGDPEE